MRTQRNFLWSASSTPGCSLPSLWVGTSPYAVRVSLFCAVASSDYCGIAECTASVTAVTPAGCVLLPTQPRNTAGGRQWWKRSCAFQAQILRTPPGCVCSCQASQEKCGIRCVFVYKWFYVKLRKYQHLTSSREAHRGHRHYLPWTACFLASPLLQACCWWKWVMRSLDQNKVVTCACG